MSLKFNPAPDLAVNVNVSEPLDKGKHREHQIVVRYKLRSVEQYQDDLEQSQNGSLSDFDLLERDIVDIDGIKDGEGQPLPFSSSLLAELVKWYWIKQPLINGWFEAQTGANIAREKNS